MLDDFVHVVNVLHLRMDGALRTDFAAQAACDAEVFDNSDFHAADLLRPAEGSTWLGRPGPQQKIKNLLNRLLIFRRERVGVDLVFSFHEMHELFGFLTVQLVPHQIIIDDAPSQRCRGTPSTRCSNAARRAPAGECAETSRSCQNTKAWAGCWRADRPSALPRV